MIHIEVQHTVADYAKWRAAFDDHKATRLAFGATGVEQVYRGVDNANAITVLTEWRSVEDAQRFTQDPGLKEAMAAGGVTSVPTVQFLNRA
jgi:heme-degrading monooxygenase HmoA